MEIDFDEQDTISNFISIPCGTYLCRIAEVRTGMTQGGDDRWSMRGLGLLYIVLRDICAFVLVACVAFLRSLCVGCLFITTPLSLLSRPRGIR